uniref:N5-carboxyaminoimidazole ribonucleotide mutase n=1 Tax=candidate division WOR-3 bacterium TaxID=2052148 RepID=A0A7V3ZW59_UNCW3
MIAIIIGSKSDITYVEEGINFLKNFEIPYELKILSAHRTPEELKEYVLQLEKRDFQVIIACAGMAAHLPGVIASYSNLPVVGVPLPTSSLQGLDALLAIVQMPSGVPVATMTIGKAGVINACVYALRILSLKYPEIKEKLKKYKEEMKEKILKENL